VTQLRWLLTAVVAAYACQLAVAHATPIDCALPAIAVILTVLAAVSYPSLMLSVGLLLVTEIAIGDESTRLLLFGAIVASAFVIALFSDARKPIALLATTLAAILLLRWIPFSDVPLGREIFLLLIAAAIVLVLGRTPFAVAVAVVTVLITPAIPMRTLLLPIAVLFVAVLARVFGMPRLVLRWPSMIVIAFVMLFFAWSGVVARAFPYFLRRAEPERPRHVVNQALAANVSTTLEVPEHATSLIVSGANVARMPRGTVLGTIEPGGRVVRIGDAADWGFLRREHFFGARNPMPRNPAGRLRDYGYAAWIDGAGRVPLSDARVIRVTAAASLPPGASIQVEGFE
jgi:hypothetical protein